MRPPRHVLKEGTWFACFGESGWADGDADGRGGALEGVFLEDVRLVELWEARFDGRALPAAWADTAESHRLVLHAAPAEYDEAIPPGSIVLVSERRIGRAGFVESWRLENHTGRQLVGRLELGVAFDLGDVAEARGLLRDRWSREIELERPRDDVVFAHYQGPDGFQVSCLFSASRPFAWEDEHSAAFDVSLCDGERFEVELRLAAVVGEGTLAAPGGAAVDAELERAVGAWRRSLAEIETDDDGVNELLARSSDDLRMLWTWTGRESGFFAAGIPHFVAPFGRDGLITALFFLMMLPEQARWTLAELARHQGTRVHPLSEEEPGKIPHEIRRGERSRPDVYPYAYASVDATLLFPVLLDQYLAWSGDVDFVREMEPALRGVLDWCANHGDTNGDGFLDYADLKHGRQGLAHRGWKDGEPGVIAHADGTEPAYPIAMVEFQGYAREALLGCERMFHVLDDPETAATCRTVADALKAAFAEAFWWPAERCLAMGLDGKGRRIECVGTNQGHCLASDLVPVELRDDVVARLMRADSFSGHGLRTVVTGAAGASPYRYQRGAVWPHDSAYVAFGLHARGYRAEANRITAGLLRAGASLPDARLPELFAGLDAAESGGRAIPLALACKPQAWAAASPFHLLRGALGLYPDALGRTVTLKPDLAGLPFSRVTVRRLRVAGGELSFDVVREGDETRVVPLEKTGDLVVRT